MKEKDILKVIKTTITDNTPNIIDRIDLDSIEIAEVEKVEEQVIEEPKEKPVKAEQD